MIPPNNKGTETRRLMWLHVRSYLRRGKEKWIKQGSNTQVNKISMHCWMDKNTKDCRWDHLSILLKSLTIIFTSKGINSTHKAPFSSPTLNIWHTHWMTARLQLPVPYQHMVAYQHHHVHPRQQNAAIIPNWNTKWQDGERDATCLWPLNWNSSVKDPTKLLITL